MYQRVHVVKRYSLAFSQSTQDATQQNVLLKHWKLTTKRVLSVVSQMLTLTSIVFSTVVAFICVLTFVGVHSCIPLCAMIVFILYIRSVMTILLRG